MPENYYPATRRDKQGRALAFSTTSDRVFNPATGASVKSEMGEVSSLSTTAKTVVPAINENKTSIDTLNQNLAGATGTFAAANSQITVDTGVDWHKLTLIQTTASGAVGRLAMLTPDFGWANIAGTGYYGPTYAAAKSGHMATIPASVFTGWLSTVGTIRWLAE